jgi:hypothetical protein
MVKDKRTLLATCMARKSRAGTLYEWHQKGAGETNQGTRIQHSLHLFERSRADLLITELVPFKRMVLESKGCNGSSRLQWNQVKRARESYITIF